MNNTARLYTRFKITALAIVSAAAAGACSVNSNEAEIPLSEVPANIITIVQDALPGISLSEAEKETKHETIIYELEGKLIDGKEYEIKVAEDGTILKIELED